MYLNNFLGMFEASALQHWVVSTKPQEQKQVPEHQVCPAQEKFSSKYPSDPLQDHVQSTIMQL